MDYVDQVWFLCEQYLEWSDSAEDICEREQAAAIANEFLAEIDLMALSCLVAGEVRIHRQEDL